MKSNNVNVPEIGSPEWYQQWQNYAQAESGGEYKPPPAQEEKPKWEDTPEGKAQIAKHAARRGAWVKDLNQLYKQGGIQGILDAGYDPYDILEKMGVKNPGRVIAKYGDQFDLGGGGGAGGGGNAHGATDWTSDAYDLMPSVTPPEWWNAMLPGQWTPETEYAALMNSLLPFLSPEDQRTISEYLYTNFPDPFSGYNPQYTNFPVPPEVTTEMQDYYTSANYAAQVLGALANFQQAAGAAGGTTGPGVQFLQQLMDVMKDFGGLTGEGQTNFQYESMLAALDPLLGQAASGDLAVYQELARMLTQPFFSQGALMPTYIGPNGEPIYGTPNPSFQ